MVLAYINAFMVEQENHHLKIKFFAKGSKLSRLVTTEQGILDTNAGKKLS